VSSQVRTSVCALDCPDACSLLVHVDGNGRGSKLRGDPNHPVTQGFLCGKPARLLYPMKRSGPKGSGQFRRVSWDEALAEAAGKLTTIAAESGGESILPYSYKGTMGMLNSAGMDHRFFHRLGASRLNRTICSSAGVAAMNATLGHRYATEPEQFRHARLIIAWGANIHGTNVHLWPFILEARRKGAKLVVIDPVQTRTARLADLHIPINPGSDLALALGLMHVILAEGLEDRAYIDAHTSGFDELKALAAKYAPHRVESLTGVAQSTITTLAREYATTRPAVIRLNYGLQRSERGGAATRAILALPALIGSWKEVGGGAQLSTSGAFQFNLPALQKPELQGPIPKRLVNMVELGKALTALKAPPVRSLIVYNSNPAAVAPNHNLVLQGLAREDLFTVVLEQFQTDTANYADLVLPVTTFLEHTDLYLGYGHYYVQLARPALPAPGETKSNVEIFRALARRMGFTDPCFDDTEDDMIRQTLASGHPFLDGITLERLDQEHSIRLNVSEPGTPFLPFARGGFGHPDGKCAFGADNLDYVPPVESRHGGLRSVVRTYPLELISSKNDDSMNSTFGNRPSVDAQTSVLYMNQADADRRKLCDGDPVRMFNRRGSIVLRARVDGAAVPPGVVRAPAVAWAGERGAINALTSDWLTDIGGGATFYSCLVQVEPA
jgi:anaerobic selenocysteine-containing dehydrogenase